MALNKYIVVAEGRNLDTYEELDISLNYQIEDILEISKRKTDFSKTITLPGTPKNNKFFNQIFSVNIDNISFNPNVRIPAQIRIGDNEIFKGFLRLTNIYIDNKEVKYEINISGSLKDIMKNIENYTLRDLDLSEYQHTRNASTIQESWAYRVYINSGLTETFADKGQGYVYPYIINGNNDGIFDKAYVQDFFPAVYVKTCIDKMFAFAGFTYTSDFFESDYFRKLILPYTGDKLQLSAEEQLTRKVIAGIDSAQTYVAASPLRARGSGWYKNDIDNSWGLGYVGAAFTRETGLVDDNGSDLEFTDTGGQLTADVFTCSKAGRYDIDIDGKLFTELYHTDGAGKTLTMNTGSLERYHRLWLFKAGGSPGTIIDSSLMQDTSSSPSLTIDYTTSAGLVTGSGGLVIDADAPLSYNLLAENLLMEPGDKIRVEIGFNHAGDVGWAGTINGNKVYARLLWKQSYAGAFSKYSVTPASNESFGDEIINLTQSLPDKFKMTEFFKDILKMFNCIVMDNPNKDSDLLIEPRDDFFASKKRIVDWNDKLDNDSQVKITPMSELDARSYLYTYKEDDDYYNKQYTEETDKVYGEMRVDVTNDFSDATNKTEVSFSPTPDVGKYINGRVAPFFVDKSDEEFKPKKVKTRILFYGGAITCNAFTLYNYDDNAYASFTVYPYCGMWDHPTSPEHSLDWGLNDKLYWSTPIVTNNTLFNEFHKKTLNNIIDVNSRLLEATFHLTPKDIAEFDFRDIIFLLGSYWRVNIIKDFNPAGADSLTKVVLYKIVDIDVISPYNIDVPLSSQACPPDMVSLNHNKPGKPSQKRAGSIYISASGKEVTEDCCKSLGGLWINGICNAIQSMPWPPNRPTKPNYPNEEAAPQPFIPYGGGQGGGGTRPPISDPVGPVRDGANNNSSNSSGTRVYGRGNYIQPGSETRLVMGNNNTVGKSTKNSIVIGDGISATESGTLYLGNIKLNQDGNLIPSGINIIDGVADDVFPFDKTNIIDIVDGSYDDVRNPGGDSKARPIIDGDIEL